MKIDICKNLLAKLRVFELRALNQKCSVYVQLTLYTYRNICAHYL